MKINKSRIGDFNKFIKKRFFAYFKRTHDLMNHEGILLKMKKINRFAFFKYIKLYYLRIRNAKEFLRLESHCLSGKTVKSFVEKDKIIKRLS